MDSYSYDIGYKVKALTGTVKDLNMDKRMVGGYFSAFDFVDSDGDMLKKGCYSKTVEERGPKGADRIKHLLQHNPENPIGRITELYEDDYGLKFTSMISDTQAGEDVLKLYRDGIYKEHSVGINIIKSEHSDEQRCEVVTEVKMWEGSTVTWGANEMALGGIAKSLEDYNYLMERYDKLNKAFYTGDYSDDVFPIIEKQRDFIEGKIRESLKNVKPSVDTSQDEAEQLKALFEEHNLKQELKSIL